MIWLDGLIATAQWFVLLPSLYLAGSLMAPFVKQIQLTLRGILFFAFGFGIFVYYLVLIGSFGMLKPLPVFVFVAALFVLRWNKIGEFIEWIKSMNLSIRSENRNLNYRLCQIVMLITGALTFAVCFLPEINHDAVCYQLNVPKMFIQQASIQPIFYEFNSYIPLFMNHLYAVALLFKSVPTAKLFHWWTGFFLFFSFFVTISEELKNKTIAIALATVLWLTPTSINEITTTYVDVAGAFFIFLSFVLYQSWSKQKEASILFLSGLLLGFGISIKLLFLMGAISMFVLLLTELRQKEHKNTIFKSLIYFIFGGFLGCGYWFIRNWIFYNNPVYPFMGHLFGTKPLGFGETYATFGVPRTIWTYLFLPFNLTFDPKSYGIGHWPGPFYLCSLPLAVIGAYCVKPARAALIFTFSFLTLWYFMAQNNRYLLPVLPIYLLSVAYGLDYTRKWFKKNYLMSIGRGVFYSYLLAFLVLTIYHYRQETLPLLGIGNKETYLRNYERTYDIAEWIDKNIPQESLMLNAGEVRQFYFNRPMLREPWFHLRHKYQEGKTHEEVLNDLRQNGFTHVLMAVNPKWKPNESAHVERWMFLQEALERDKKVKKMITINSKNIRDDRFIYTVYQSL